MEIPLQNFQNLQVVLNDDRSLRVFGNKDVRDVLTDHKMEVQNKFKIVIFPKKDSATLKGGTKETYRSVFNFVFNLKSENEITTSLWEDILAKSLNVEEQTSKRKMCRSYSTQTPNRYKPTSRKPFYATKIDTTADSSNNESILEFSPRNLYKNSEISKREQRFCQASSYNSPFKSDSACKLNFNNSSDSTLTQPEVEEVSTLLPQVGLNIVGNSLKIKFKGAKADLSSIQKIKSVLGLNGKISLQKIVFL